VHFQHFLCISAVKYAVFEQGGHAKPVKLHQNWISCQFSSSMLCMSG